MKKKFDFNFNKKSDDKKTETKPSRKDFKTFKEKIPFENDQSAPTTTIYVGNLNYKRTEETIKDLFTPFGYVKSVKIVLKEGTELKTGFAFVEMTNTEKAQKAITSLNGKLVDDRTLKVSVANSRF